MAIYINLEVELMRKNITKRELANKTGIRYNTLIDKLNNKFGFCKQCVTQHIRPSKAA